MLITCNRFIWVTAYQEEQSVLWVVCTRKADRFEYKTNKFHPHHISLDLFESNNALKSFSRKYFASENGSNGYRKWYSVHLFEKFSLHTTIHSNFPFTCYKTCSRVIHQHSVYDSKEFNEWISTFKRDQSHFHQHCAGWFFCSSESIVLLMILINWIDICSNAFILNNKKKIIEWIDYKNMLYSLSFASKIFEKITGFPTEIKMFSYEFGFLQYPENHFPSM